MILFKVVRGRSEILVMVVLWREKLLGDVRKEREESLKRNA